MDCEVLIVLTHLRELHSYFAFQVTVQFQVTKTYLFYDKGDYRSFLDIHECAHENHGPQNILSSHECKYDSLDRKSKNIFSLFQNRCPCLTVNLNVF